MANTAVKDVSSLFLNRTVPAAGKAAGGGDFQKVWNRQLNKGLSDRSAKKRMTAFRRKRL